MRRKPCVLFFAMMAVVLCAQNLVVGQKKPSIAQAKTASQTSAPSKATTQEDLRSNPVLLMLSSGGTALQADLIGPDPEDPDSILVDIEGRRRTVKIDDVTIIQQPSKYGEYGNLASNDMKAHLDNFAIEIKSTPGAVGYLVGYGSCVDQARGKLKLAADYLIYTRGVDGVITVEGGCRTTLTTEMWIVPDGASPPTASTERIISPCPKCGTAKPKPKPKPKPKRRRG